MEGYFDKEEFEYCVNEYKKEVDIVNICGVVLYSARNAHTNKVLKDKEFLNGLNEVSGKKVPIFYLVNKENCSDCFSDNGWVMEMFKIRSTEDFPLLVLFVRDNDDNYHSMSVKLQDSNTDVFYRELCELLVVINKAVDNISEDNFHSQDGVFNTVSYAVKDYNEKKAVKKYVPIVWELVTKVYLLNKIFGAVPDN